MGGNPAAVGGGESCRSSGHRPGCDQRRGSNAGWRGSKAGL